MSLNIISSIASKVGDIRWFGIKNIFQNLNLLSMEYVYKDWYKRPIDKLYNFISNTYFSDFQNNSCFIAQGLMAGVLPF